MNNNKTMNLNLSEECIGLFNKRQIQFKETEDRCAAEYLPKALEQLRQVLSFETENAYQEGYQKYSGNDIRVINSLPHMAEFYVDGISFRVQKERNGYGDGIVYVLKTCPVCSKDYSSRPVMNKADIGEALVERHFKLDCSKSGEIPSLGSQLEDIIRQICGGE